MSRECRAWRVSTARSAAMMVRAKEESQPTSTAVEVGMPEQGGVQCGSEQVLAEVQTVASAAATRRRYDNLLPVIPHKHGSTWLFKLFADPRLLSALGMESVRDIELLSSGGAWSYDRSAS